MRPLISTLSLTVIVALAWSAATVLKTSAAPLCTLSPSFVRHILESDAIVGAAVYDLRTGTVWSGGHVGPFAMHSMMKPPIAFGILSDVEEGELELTRRQRDALYYMVSRSQNSRVDELLSTIGGLSGLRDFYVRWDVPEMVELMHPSRWGINLAEPEHLARLYGALATSKEIPDNARLRGFDLLRAVIDDQRWGTDIPEQALPGWESLIKTGNYTIPVLVDVTELDNSTNGDADNEEQAQSDTGEQDSQDEQSTKILVRGGDTPLRSEATMSNLVVRMNSAAIWLAPPWQGSEPRYVVSIMMESFLSWTKSRHFQDQLGDILAEAIIQRESGQSETPSPHCIKRALS